MAGSPTEVEFWTADVVAQACQITNQYGPNVEKQWPILFKIAGMYGLQDRDVLAAMCGVIGHETAHQWWSIHEFGTNFSRYGYAPNGQDYGGRGLIQHTWASGYKALQDSIAAKFGLKYDLVNNPDLLLNDPVLAAHSACDYWTEHAGGILVPMSKQHNYGEVIHYVWGLNIPGNKDFDQYFKELTYAANYLLSH